MKKKVIDLAAIVDALDLHFEGHRIFLDRETGEVHDFGPEELDAADNDKDLGAFPEWKQPLVELARDVFSDASDRFVELPDQWEINEYRALERFSESQADPAITDQLLRSIQGSGAYRRFKDTVNRLGIAASWYAYRLEYLREIARDWCEANDVPLTTQSP